MFTEPTLPTKGTGVDFIESDPTFIVLSCDGTVLFKIEWESIHT